MKRWIFVLLVLGVAPAAWAHDASPAFLRIDEVAPGRYQLLWRTPHRMPIRLPDDVRTVGEPDPIERRGAVVERRMIEGRPDRIDFPGLQGNALVRVGRLGGETSTTLVEPSRPWADLREDPGGAYVRLGFDHVFRGYDHLLFLLALLLIARRAVIRTIPAFTLAHLLTPALAALGLARAPPVEASVALCLVLLAGEIVRGGERLGARWPFLVALAFGLLHGLGFAGRLTELGLPRGEVPLALLAFNAGVEVGQLAFLAAAGLVVALAGRLAAPARLLPAARRWAPLAIGSLAACWLFQRLADFVP